MIPKINIRRLSSHSLLILLLGILLITGLGLYVYYQINNDYRRTIDEVSQETMNLSTAFEEYTRKIIAEGDLQLINIKKAYETNELSSADFIKYPLITLGDANQSLVAVYNEQGIVIASSLPNRLGVNRFDRDYFMVHRDVDSQKLNIGKTITGKVGGQDVIPLTRRINRADGSFAGIVYTEIKVAHLLEFYQKINLGENQLIALTGMDGFNRARQVGQNLETGQDTRGSVFWDNVQANHANASYVSTNILDGVTRVTSYRIMPEYPLIVVVGKSTNVSLAGYERRKQSYIIGGLLVSLFILIFCVLLVSRHERIRKLADVVLQEKERLSALINSLSDEVWFYDEKERLTLVNSAVSQNFKINYARIDVKDIADNFEALRSDWSTRPLDEMPSLRAFRGETVINQHEIIKNPVTGEWRHREVNATAVKDINGTIIGAVSVVKDITARKRMEDELIKHRAHLEGLVLERTTELENAINNLKIAGSKMAEQSKLLDFAHDYIMVRDLKNRVLYWNQGAEKGYGFTAAEARGQETYQLLQTQFPEPENVILSKLLASGHWEGELKHTCKEGVQIVVQSNQTLNLDENGNPVSIMEINHDITEKKNADQKVRELNLRLQKFNDELENTVAQRTMELQNINAALEEEIMERQEMEKSLLKVKEEAERANVAKSKFLANMSHEIRTPMNGIIGMTDITLMTDLEEKQREYLNVVKSSTMALMRVLNDILDYSKIEAGKIELEETLFDIRETMTEVVNLFTIAAEQKGLCIKLNIASHIPHTMIGDSVRLRQVLSNLVGNGVKFTLQGQIVIDITIEEQYEEKIKLMFVVADTGIGIPDNKLDKLFKRFSQIDDSHTKQFSGTGLGLAISQKLVEIMNGQMGVESRDGVGSRFFFSATFGLCNTMKISSSESIQPKLIPHENFKTKTVLLAEDDTVSKRLVEIILNQNGFRVIAVENGKEAIDAFEKEKMDMILMDINMPYLDGYSATSIIRSKEKNKEFHTPIIAMTAYALKGDQQKCLEAGMDDYISKPIELEKFLALLNKWL